MTVQRGEIWLADLNPTRGSEQAGVRPVLVFQNELVSKFSTTVLAIPLTTNLRRASLPTCVRISQGEGGLTSDSVALCHQLRVLDRMRLRRNLGRVSRETLSAVESVMLFTLGITL
jgi:mRNA interferase MazF